MARILKLPRLIRSFLREYIICKKGICNKDNGAFHLIIPVPLWRPNPFLPIPGSLYPVFPWSGWSISGMNPNLYAFSNPLGTYNFQQPSVYNLFQPQQLSHAFSFSPYQSNIMNINTSGISPFQGHSGYNPFSIGGCTGWMNQGIIPGYSGFLQYPNLSSYF